MRRPFACGPGPPGVSSPSVPAAARASLADADDEADQPDDEDHEGDPPKHVQDEAEAAEDECEQEDEQDDAHEVLSPSVTGCGTGAVPRSMPFATPGAPAYSACFTAPGRPGPAPRAGDGQAGDGTRRPQV